jgi:hypothetical protein
MINELEISEETIRKLRNLGNLNSTDESVILDLISHAKSCDRFWENRFD